MDLFSSQVFELTPVRYGSFRATLAEVARAILEGPGFIVLVGACGSGKTTLLYELVHEIGKPIASVLKFGHPIRHNTSLGIYDDVDEAAMQLLESSGQLPDLVLIALRPEALDAATSRFPRSKIVRMTKMSIEDVRQMIEERSSQLELPKGTFTPWAISELTALSEGCPFRLDQMIQLSAEIAKKASSIPNFPDQVSQTETWKGRQSDSHDVVLHVEQSVKFIQSTSTERPVSRHSTGSFEILRRPLSPDERRKATRLRLMRRAQRAVLSPVSAKLYIIFAIVLAAYLVFSIEVPAVRLEKFWESQH